MLNIDIQIKNKKKTYHFAENWNEISEKNFIRYFHYFLYICGLHNDKELKEDQKKIIIEELKYKMVPALFTDIPKRILLLLEEYQIKSLSTHTSFLFNKESKLFKIIINKIKIKFKTFYGPKDKFHNVSFGEFIYADTYYINFYNTKDNSYIDKLIACLYRKKGNDKFIAGDIRNPFNSNLIEKNSRYFKNLPNIYKQIILFNYSIIRTYITELYPIVFEGTSKASDIISPRTIQGWDDFIKSISQNVFEIKQYSEENMHNVLSYLNSKLANNKN